jgi:hypothetical protein
MGFLGLCFGVATEAGSNGAAATNLSDAVPSGGCGGFRNACHIMYHSTDTKLQFLRRVLRLSLYTSRRAVAPRQSAPCRPSRLASPRPVCADFGRCRLSISPGSIGSQRDLQHVDP